MRILSTGLLLISAAIVTLCSCQSAPRNESEAAPVKHVTQPTNLGTKPMTVAGGNVYLGGQPSRADLAAAARYPGLRTVLDFRRDTEHRGFDEAGDLEELGLRYESVPFGGADTLTDEVLESSLHVIQTSERPLLVHCASGNRVGAVWMAWLMLEDGYSEEEALAEARQVGLRSDAFIPVVLDYVERKRASAQPAR